jgi:hypothetical protein
LDGPRGPARVAQPGAVWLASATGNPLLPFHLEASSYWSARSWDRTQVPKPFSTVALVVGQPMEVKRDASDEALDQARLEVERALAALESRAQAQSRDPRAESLLKAPALLVRCGSARGRDPRHGFRRTFLRG